MKAVCEWETSSIVLCLDGSSMILLEEPTDKHKFVKGCVSEGQVMLPVTQAKRLVYSLLSAIGQYETIDKDLDQCDS